MLLIYWPISISLKLGYRHNGKPMGIHTVRDLPSNSVSILMTLLAICRPSGCTVVSGVVVVVGGGVCNRSQMRTSKCTCLIFGQKCTKGISDTSKLKVTRDISG